ncbi:hypothetical protein SRB5_24380 [Streptomyces sp. RB5]|uniref:Uncharacterized protein n=1 Tax=Streptomyces smaragdinus TaxID=2585196 RepID=A0A7K0CFQ2_9ACTN|nr:hypothetical protein [Streptomyces smaragdinus]MQY12305.1 hypothetical protein [Streptomyces smaragdinus]
MATGREEGAFVSDEEWERFQRGLTDGSAVDAPKEPSARARMVTERLRHGDELQALRERKRRSRIRRRLLLVTALLVAGGAVAAAALTGRLGLPGSGGDTDTGIPAPSVPVRAEPLPDTPTLARPFSGSPAEDYADGAAGIVLPKARPVGRMSVQQVDFALRRTRDLLVAASLDPSVLEGGRPDAALALIDPKATDIVGKMKRSLRSPSEKDDPADYFPRFDPAKFRLVGDVVKVRGTMSFREGDHESVLVRADYTFVYPVHKAPAGTEVSRVIVRRVLETVVADPARVKVTPGTLWIRNWSGERANGGCGFTGGWLVPGFPGEEPAGDAEKSPERVDPYDRGREIKGGDEVCRTMTRT